MPIRYRGELPDPHITAIRNLYTRPQSLNIDLDVYIEISMVATPDVQLYFTTDGSVPAPFKRWIGGREVTFRYTAPFALKSGKRVVRAVAVSRDGLLSSRVVSKTFMVHGNGYDICDTCYDVTDSYLDEDWSDSWDTDTDTSVTRGRHHWKTCKSWYQDKDTRRISRPVSADRGWIASTRRYPYNVETLGREETDKSRPPTSQGQIPDGPFNPVNYSGTQINVWGAPPGSVWAPPPGMAAYGGVAPANRTQPHMVQRGLLTREMLENSGASDSSALEDDNRPLTVADVRRILAESEAETAAESSASAAEEPEKTRRKSSKSLRSGNVSFSGLARSGKALVSSYRDKKK